MTAMQLDAMLRLRTMTRKPTPVLKTIAVTGEGVGELADEVAALGDKLDKRARAEASRSRLRRLLLRAAGQTLDKRLKALPDCDIDDLSKAVLDGKLDFDQASEQLLKKAKL